jgi:hypothetical protein
MLRTWPVIPPARGVETRVSRAAGFAVPEFASETVWCEDVIYEEMEEIARSVRK